MVQQKVKQIALSISGLYYIYNDWNRANFEIDNSQLPVCVSILPSSGQFNLLNGHFRDYPNCSISFLDKADLDFDGEENETAVERMKDYAKQFIQAINNSGQFAPVSNLIPYKVVYDYLDQNLTGVTIEVQLKELYGDCIL